MAFTMPATPRSATTSEGYNSVGSASGGMVTGGSGGTRTRSMRGVGVVFRNGNPMANAKVMSLPGSATTRTSSTLPRMSARQLQQPIPHATPSFLRPNSAFIQPSTVPVTASQLLNHQGRQGFQPHGVPPPPLSSSSASGIAMTSTFLPPNGGSVPPPLPPRTYEMSDKDMDELCKKVTDHALQDGERKFEAARGVSVVGIKKGESRVVLWAQIVQFAGGIQEDFFTDLF